MKSPIIKKFRPGNAKQAFVIQTGRLVDHLRALYGRSNLGIKVFDYEEIKDIEDFKTVRWGDDPPKGEPRRNTKLWEATQIQNIASWHGLAPRVYGLATVYLCDAYRPIQLIELLEEKPAPTQDEAVDIYNKVIALGKTYGFNVDKRDVSQADVLCGKLVDFQTFAFTKSYKETVKELYIKGKYGKVYYQDVPELGLHGGPRKSEERIKMLGLDKLHWKGRNVLDVGCAGGFFTRYASEQEASRVVGIDIDEGHINASRHMANLLGHFNNDYILMDVRKNNYSGYPQVFDTTLFLSMNYHVDFPDWIIKCTSKTIVFEDNGRESRNSEKLDPKFASRFAGGVEFMGRATDHGDKPIYHLKVEKE